MTARRGGIRHDRPNRSTRLQRDAAAASPDALTLDPPRRLYEGRLRATVCVDALIIRARQGSFEIVKTH